MSNDSTPSDEPTYEELLAKITHPKKLAFLEAFPKYGINKVTAKAVGIDESSPYMWQHKDGLFLQAFQALKKRVDQERLQIYEAELESRALGGTSKQSDILLMFALKAEAPSKYREAVQALPFTGTIKVELSVPRPGQQLPPAPEPKQLPEGGKQ